MDGRNVTAAESLRIERGSRTVKDVQFELAKLADLADQLGALVAIRRAELRGMPAFQETAKRVRAGDDDDISLPWWVESGLEFAADDLTRVSRQLRSDAACTHPPGNKKARPVVLGKKQGGPSNRRKPIA